MYIDTSENKTFTFSLSFPFSMGNLGIIQSSSVDCFDHFQKTLANTFDNGTKPPTEERIILRSL